MLIIPAINEIKFPEILKKILRAGDFGAEWVHIDVADGQFTGNALWNNPEDLSSLKDKNIKIEVHLMVQNPEAVIGQWITAGVRRIIVHIEALQDFTSIQEQCLRAGVELVVALNPDTSVERLTNIATISRVLVLAVQPGRAGQMFRNDQLDKVRFLRTHYSNVTISVDGGVALDNALPIQAAGADILISASAIWSSDDPAMTYRNFQQLCAGSN
ncbi:MAG TPA: hypothetical protein VJH70_00940 [Candidatus Paceibacterota bacterium]